MAAELSALSVCCASITLQGRGRAGVLYASFSPSVLKRILALLKRLYGFSAFPRFTTLSRLGGQRRYELHLRQDDSRRLLSDVFGRSGGKDGRLSALPTRMIRRICCRRAWIRGAFLGCGSLSNPERGYRAEFGFDTPDAAEYLLKLLGESSVQAARIIRRVRHVVYVRQGDSVVTLLSLMGAIRATLATENVRAAGDLQRGLNRVANCDHANMMKQLSAAQAQLQAITAISRNSGLSSLPAGLEEMARLRIAHPDAPLMDLAGMTKPILSKSGAQYRMKRLLDIAGDIKEA